MNHRLWYIRLENPIGQIISHFEHDINVFFAPIVQLKGSHTRNVRTQISVKTYKNDISNNETAREERQWLSLNTSKEQK
eukprot:m.124213 g.124213  ORF g.124213 m.124213 type:complete len:79 (-) comp13771_c1_seq3:469-705(-)